MLDLTNEHPTKVLLTGNNPDDSVYLEKVFSETGHANLEFLPLDQLSEIDLHSFQKVPDIVFLDGSIGEDDILRSFLTVHNVIPQVPVVVLMEAENIPLAVQVLSEGAQDCLVKSNVNSRALKRILNFVLARQSSIRQLQSFSLVDQLTGLYNRRGFLALGEHQLKLANRTGQSLLLAFVDLDGLKTINDLLGHQRGDLALIETAHVLREAFRETDILARLGGDEFVALFVCGGETQAETLQRQFQKTLEEHNSFGQRSFKLSASIGVAISDPHSPSSLNDLLERADQLMYEQKKSARRPGMVYQLRFLKSVPVSAWLRNTASLLNAVLPEGTWPSPPPPLRTKVKKLRRALTSGLLTFVERRSLCGSAAVCDLGCSPAPENKSPDRFAATVILGPAYQYLVREVQNLAEMSERLVEAVLWECPGASALSDKIQMILQDALSSHLYENTKCLQVPLCRRSRLMDFKRELRHH